MSDRLPIQFMIGWSLAMAIKQAARKFEDVDCPHLPEILNKWADSCEPGGWYLVDCQALKDLSEAMQQVVIDEIKSGSD